MNLTYVELFAGAGGMSLGLEMAGWRCVAHAEIEPHARAVLRHHWPDVPLYGDVSQLDGRQFKGVTMLTGGSPCQDLSIAGKRAGMADGTRSSLFFEQIRIWEEMEAPLILWENVYGAFSSQDGRDFAAVLSAIVGRAVAVPRDGWRRGGVASGPTGIAAWRVLDAQYFGVPQRRRRVFVLGTRDPRFDPAEILSLLDGLSGHLASSGEAREGVAADSGTGASRAYAVRTANTGANGHGIADDVTHTLDGANGQAVLTFDARGKRQGVAADARAGATEQSQSTGFSFSDFVGYISDVMPTIPVGVAKGTGSQMMGVLAFTPGNLAREAGPRPSDKTFSCLLASATSDQNAHVLTYSTPAIGDIREDAVASTMTKNTGGGGETQNPAFVVAVDIYNQTINLNGIAHTIRTSGGDNVPHAISFDNRPHISTDGVIETLTTEGTRNPMSVVMRQREGKPGGGKGPLLSAERERTLGTANDQVLFTKNGLSQYANKGVASTICARDYKDATDLSVVAGVPRRLTPMECERLMGWPDLHTAIGINEKGVTYELADTARYKLCGNGIASPVTAWIGFQLRAAVEAID